jgi:orotidine-5'-phosphate decarboxylase
MALKQRLLDLSFKKQSVLCVAVDVELSMDLLAIADAIGPFICVLKVKKSQRADGIDPCRHVKRLFIDCFSEIV